MATQSIRHVMHLLEVAINHHTSMKGDIKGGIEATFLDDTQALCIYKSILQKKRELLLVLDAFARFNKGVGVKLLIEFIINI